MNQNQSILSINGIDTQIILTSYVDRHFVVISQSQKFGTFISAETLRTPEGSVQYETKVLFGKRDDILLQIYARQIIEKISRHSDLPLLLAICLVEDGREVSIFETILNTIEEIHTW